MVEQSSAVAGHESLLATGQGKSSWRQYSLIGALLVAVLACAILGWLDRRWGPLPEQETDRYGDAAPATAPQLLPLPSTTTSVAYLKVQPGTEERDDIFYCTTQAITHTCTNLTQSPAIAEAWPVLNPASTLPIQISYYGVSKAGIDLFIMDVPTGSALPLTVRAGSSGLHASHEITPTHPPVFSPDGQWVAFPAQAVKGNAIELFAVRTDGQQVLPVTDLGHRIRDYLWTDNETLAIVTQRSDKRLQYFVARFTAGEFDTQDAMVIDR